MKKLKYLIALFAFLFLFGLASCSKASLPSPTNLSVNIENRLTWDAVDNARTYVIDITGPDDFQDSIEIRRTYYSLSNLNEGDYQIKIKAVSSDTAVESDWSSQFSFHRDYESGCVYTLINNNTEYEITRSGSASGALLIEDTYRGKPVTSIADAAFRGNGKITSVTLGANIRSIGENAFYNCSKLASINIPSSVKTIGKAAFQSCKSLTAIAIPNSITVINDYTFAYCSLLTTVSLADSIEILGASAFENCVSLKSIILPKNLTSLGEYSMRNCTTLTTVSINSAITSIPSYCFTGCISLANVLFEDNSNLTTIGDEVFSGCVSLKTIALPEGLESIGKRVFTDCTSLESVSIPDSLNKMGQYCFIGSKIYTDATSADSQFVYADDWVVAYNSQSSAGLIKEITKTTFKDGVKGIASYVFYGCTELTQVYLADSITAICEYTFANNPMLWRFRTSDETSLKYIGNFALSYNAMLSTVLLKEGLLEIGNYAFYGDTLVANNAQGDSFVPSTVTRIGTRAFENTGIWANPDESGVVYAGKWVVGYVGTATSIAIKSDTLGVSNYAFYQQENLGTITGLGVVKYIGYGAFYQCTNLASVSLNKNIKTIEGYTFYKCTSLFTVSLPSALEVIGDYAFYKCTNLSEMDLSKSRLQSIGRSAFYCDANLKTVTFGEDLEKVGDYAFYKCTALTSAATMQNNITYLGIKSFYKCEALTEATISNKLKTIQTGTFSGCIALTSIYIPDSVTLVESQAFYKCSAVTSLRLSDKLETIGTYAFGYLKSVTTLVIPKSVTTIDKFGFMGMNSLSSILLRSSVTNVAQHAFYGCKSATIYTDCVSIPDTWHTMFNSSYRPIIYGATLSNDGSYVVSIIVTSTSIYSPIKSYEKSAPERAGYEFGGWTTTIKDEEGNDEEVVLQANEISKEYAGYTLVAVWNVLA